MPWEIKQTFKDATIGVTSNVEADLIHITKDNVTVLELVSSETKKETFIKLRDLVQAANDSRSQISSREFRERDILRSTKEVRRRLIKALKDLDTI